MIHVSRELLKDWYNQLAGGGDKFIIARQVADSIKALLLDGVAPAYVPRSDELRAAGAKVVDVPAIPVQPAPNYRIQIEDGAWVGTLDEWRALLKLSGERAGKSAQRFTFGGCEFELCGAAANHTVDEMLKSGWTVEMLAGSAHARGVPAAKVIGEPVIDYLVIRTSDEEGLLRRVATAIMEGWVCQGGVSITSCTRTGNVIAAQAMVRK